MADEIVYAEIINFEGCVIKHIVEAKTGERRGQIPLIDSKLKYKGRSD